MLSLKKRKFRFYPSKYYHKPQKNTTDGKDIFSKLCLYGKCMIDAYELPLFFCGKYEKAFLQKGFFNDTALTSAIHKHFLTEIHIQTEGEAKYEIGDNIITLKKDQAFIIPGGVYHKTVGFDEHSKQIAFQISAETRESRKITLLPFTGEKIRELTKELSVPGNADVLSACLSLVCSEFFKPENAYSLEKTKAREYLIREFFANRYSENVTLSDLAEALSLSTKQTAREVEKYMGKSFGEILRETRLEIAKKLISENKLSLSEISEQVGYTSYSGFWKALKS